MRQAPDFKGDFPGKPHYGPPVIPRVGAEPGQNR